MRKEAILLIVAIVLLIAVNYPFLDKALEEFLEENKEAVVNRIIDGDTIEIENKTSVRLLGINTPEKGELYYTEAKDFLEMILLNKTVSLEFGRERYDLYGRLLAYVFFNDKNVNKEMVDEGYANIYFPAGRDKYYAIFAKAWEHCIQNNKYLCERSTDNCAACINIESFEEQEVVFYNKCSYACNLTGWSIKDQGRKKFVFGEFVLKAGKQVMIVVGNETNSDDVLYWQDEDYVWTSSGDTLFLRDEKGKLVLWEKY